MGVLGELIDNRLSGYSLVVDACRRKEPCFGVLGTGALAISG